jgi:hypothetical protein
MASLAATWAQDRTPKWILFSIWYKTSTENDPNADPEELAKLISKGKYVKVERFGGEGTGRKSYLEYDWKFGQTYQQVNVRPSPESDKLFSLVGFVSLI